MSPPFDSSDGKMVRQSTQKLVKFTEPRPNLPKLFLANNITIRPTIYVFSSDHIKDLEKCLFPLSH